LLAFSRQQTLSLKAVDVGRPLTSMGKLFSRTFGDNIHVRIHIEVDTDAALVDPGQLENGVFTLSINVRNAMPDGGRLTLAARNVDLDGSFFTTNADAPSLVSASAADRGG
jgi:hypothetical protein